MGGKKISERSIKRKSAPTHPNSRRAAQLARVSHRKSKLQTQKGVRNKLTSAKVDRLSTLILLLPDDKVCLPDLYSVHDFINTFYLSRHDDEIEELQSQRRPGQPASRRQIELTHVRDRERQLYQEGMEIPDLTCEINVRLLREWDGDPQALPMFKMVRVSGTYRDQCTVMHIGNHKQLVVMREKEVAAAKEREQQQQEQSGGDPDTAMET